jgi:glyoxylase-like metal-dependent hydrolase (beta-lactamase superfamily II)
MDAITVGSLAILPIYDGTARLTSSMFTTEDGAEGDWGPHQHALHADGSFVVPVGAFLVNTGAQLVLLDAGVGPLHDEMFSGGALLDSLRAYGVEPEDIDTVAISHLHSDHMGWLEHNETITFPRANIWIGAADWEHFVVNQRGGHRRADRLRIVEPNVSLIDADDINIAPGITTRQTPGHTPGHTSMVISSGTERLIMMGDALHCPAQLTETEWQFLYDTDPALAKQSRAQLLREAEIPHTSLLPCHFPGMVATRLIHGEGQRQWVMSSAA